MLIGVLADEPQSWIAREIERTDLGGHVVRFNSAQDLDEALLQGDVSAAVRLLSALPVTQPDGIVIAALSERRYPSGALLVSEKNERGARILDAASAASVWVSDPLVSAQLRQIAPALRLLSGPRPEIDQTAEAIRSGRCEAAYIAEWEWELSEKRTEGLKVITLHPLEVTPRPGQGVLAWQTHRDNITLRERLQVAHRSDAAALTNVERRLARAFDGRPVCAFCVRDAQGYYHAFAALADDGILKRAKASQSTHVGLAERLFASLSAN
ncbi:MAG: hypothetical protein ACK4NS_05850 [Saprospiraceae bacterium]